jgi:hypothetical protein
VRESHPGEIAYGDAFFAGIEEGAQRSAEIVVPLLIELFSPRSVVDFGGGVGRWGAAFLARGVSDVLSVDGPWVPQTARAVPPDRFLEHDLSAPLALERTFDLALCLEAAEHLPASAAPELVCTLTNAAPVVVFSAALPGQGGDGHVNEQPPEYWAKLFAARDYACFGGLRRRIWGDAAIEVWYRQNLLCFVRRSAVARWRPVLGPPSDESDGPLGVAHPELLRRHKDRGDRLEVYAQRLEGDAETLRRELTDARWTLDQRQAELDAVLRTRVWRAWRCAVSTAERLRGLFGGSG